MTADAYAREQRTSSQDKPDESRAYKQWYETYQGRDNPRAIELARQYLQSYPNGIYESYLKKWIESAEKQMLKEQPLSDHRLEAVAIAAAGGHEEVLISLMQLLIDEGGDVNMKIKDGKTALMLAAATGSTGAVKLLIRNGANVNLKEEKYGYSALIYAVWWGATDTVLALIESGADVNVKDVDEASALSIAIIREHADVVKILKKAGAKQ